MSQLVKWFSQLEATTQLHVPERTLIGRHSSQFLKHGKHWRQTLPSARFHVLYNIKQCEKNAAKARLRNGVTLAQDTKNTS